MPNIYDQVRAQRPRRSPFNLSHEVKLTCDMGQLVPVLCEEAVPGDYWEMAIQAVVRLMPAVAPVLHEIDFYYHCFFIPNRLLDDDWESFVTGGFDGQDAHTMDTWIPTHADVINSNGVTVKDNGVGSLWDYFGFPVTDAGIIPAGVYPLAFPRRAYNLVFNEYYRDETLITAAGLDDVKVRNRAWPKDYFTSALPWQQRGIAPAIPITGLGAAEWDPAHIHDGTMPGILSVQNVGADTDLYAVGGNAADHIHSFLNDNVVDLSGATTFTPADLRLVFAIQKWMEANARGGARYTEFLREHFGVAPRDERLQRPEYIGGTRMPMMISEVLQTSASAGTPQGNMAGHGLVAAEDHCGKYHVDEYGWILGIISIMPVAVYTQGINRQFLRETRYDYYSPEWAHLSEQAVLRGELYADGVEANNKTPFGYQGRFNEMRSKQSRVAGLMRPGVSGSLGTNWNLARSFGSAPALNEEFITCIPRKDFLAAPSQPACIVNIGHVIKAVRPMPEEAEPGLMDHSA